MWICMLHIYALLLSKMFYDVKGIPNNLLKSLTGVYVREEIKTKKNESRCIETKEPCQT